MRVFSSVQCESRKGEKMSTSATVERLGFEEEQREHFLSVFDKAFERLDALKPSKNSAHVESNNHFDEEFHQELLGGLHLNIKF